MQRTKLCSVVRGLLGYSEGGSSTNPSVTINPIIPGVIETPQHQPVPHPDYEARQLGRGLHLNLGEVVSTPTKPVNPTPMCPTRPPHPTQGGVEFSLVQPTPTKPKTLTDGSSGDTTPAQPNPQPTKVGSRTPTINDVLLRGAVKMKAEEKNRPPPKGRARKPTFGNIKIFQGGGPVNPTQPSINATYLHNAMS